MPRKPSPADQALIDYAAAAGYNVSARQIERWRQLGLVPRNVRKRLGRGKGTSSRPPLGAGQAVVRAARYYRWSTP